MTGPFAILSAVIYNSVNQGSKVFTRHLHGVNGHINVMDLNKSTEDAPCPRIYLMLEVSRSVMRQSV